MWTIDGTDICIYAALDLYVLTETPLMISCSIATRGPDKHHWGEMAIAEMFLENV